MKDFEKEYMLYGILRRARWEESEPQFLKRYRNRKFFNKITAIYGNDIISETYKELRKNGVIEYRNNVYVLTKRGKALYKRGWVEYKINKYDNPKYPLLVSILALIISIIGTDNIWKEITWIWDLF